MRDSYEEGRNGVVWIALLALGYLDWMDDSKSSLGQDTY